MTNNYISYHYTPSTTTDLAPTGTLTTSSWASPITLTYSLPTFWTYDDSKGWRGSDNKSLVTYTDNPVLDALENEQRQLANILEASDKQLPGEGLTFKLYTGEGDPNQTVNKAWKLQPKMHSTEPEVSGELIDRVKDRLADLYAHARDVALSPVAQEIIERLIREVIENKIPTHPTF